MPVLKTKFLRSGFEQPKTANNSLSTTVADSQLAILEDKFRKDGFISIADYQKLAEKGRELSNLFNGNTKEGRNSIASLEAKISGYEDKINTIKLQDTEVDRVRTSATDDIDVIKMDNAGKPKTFFTEATTRLKESEEQISKLYEAAETSGNIKASNDYLALFKETESKRMQFESLSKSLGSDKKTVGAFVTTDAQGIPVDVEYRALTSDNIGKYVETNANIDKVPVWLLPNQRSGGVRSASIGGHVFSDSEDGPVDIQSILVGGQRAKRLVSGTEDIALKEQDLTIRPYIPDETWARGKGGLYKNLGNNKYAKYSDTTFEELGLRENDVQPVNRIWENRINENVIQTGDPSLVDPEANVQIQDPIQSSVPEQDVEGGQAVVPQFRGGGGSRTPSNEAKEETGGFTKTVGKIFRGIFRGGGSQTQEQSPDQTTPSFLDEL